MTNYEHFIEIVEKCQDELRTNPHADAEKLAMRIEMAKKAMREMTVSVAQMEYKEEEF